METPVARAASAAASPGGRLLSLDALRGMDMLMIMGFGRLVICLCAALGFPDCALAQQFRHVEWDGLRFEDTIFPLFLFLAGVSWPFSHASQAARGATRGAIALRCLRRALVLFALGLVYNGLLQGQLRMGAVLSRIGVAWFVGAMLFMTCRRRTLAFLALALPIGYWLLLAFVPAPDAQTLVVPDSLAVVREFGTGPFSIVGNLSGWVDRHFMPGILSPYAGIADNQSALGYIPAVGTALLGILTGDFVRRTRHTLPDGRRVAAMFCAAAALAGLGLWIAHGFGELSMPINKKLWSASFTFVVGGYSVAAFALFHYLIDVCGFTRGIFFFQVIGMNAITIYLAQKFIPFSQVSKNVFGGLAKLLPPAGGELVLAAGYVALCWLLLWALHKKGIYLKV